MRKIIDSPFIQLPDIPLSIEDAYNITISGGIVRIKFDPFLDPITLEVGSVFKYFKQHPRRRGKFIFSSNKSFIPFETFCIARSKEAFLDRFFGFDNMFYLDQ